MSPHSLQMYSFTISKMTTKRESLHFVMLPLMSPGHFIPMLDMAKLLAQQNVHVTIVTSPVIVSRFSPHVERAKNSGLSISLLSLPFPTSEVGLPEGCESLDLVPSKDLVVVFFRALFSLTESFEELFEKIEPKPSCIISDMYLTWVAESAKKFNVPRIIFDGTSCFTTLSEYSLYLTKAYENVDESGFLVLPNLPDRIEIRRDQLPIQFTYPATEASRGHRERVKESSKKAYGVVINTFEEMEIEYVEELKRLKNGKVWCVGPLSLCNNDNLDKLERGDKAVIGERECLEWLDRRETGSVVYVCLGSLAQLTLAQVVELGSGLEESKRAFVWVLRGTNEDDVEKWIREDGFDERTRGLGLIIRGWAPQVLILSHPAIGAFLTHCGWNSILEAICAGIPMITWPMFAEQFLNEKLVIEVLKAGVRVGNEQVVDYYSEDKFQFSVKREQIVEALEKAMDREDEGQKIQERVKELGEMAMRAMKVGGSSQLNMTLLIEDIAELVNHK